MAKSKSRAQRCWTGCQPAPTHGCGPATARHGDFGLLGLPPGPVRPSLGDLDAPSSPGTPISMPGLARTPDLHGALEGRSPALTPSADSSLPVAGLQEHATTPSDRYSEF